MIQGSRVKLYEFHVLHRPLGPIDHGNAVTSGNHGVGGCLVDGANTTGSHEGCLGQKGVYFPCPHVQNIGSVTLNVIGMPGDILSQMMLRQDFNGKMVTVYVNVGMVFNPVDQGLLDFSTRRILVVQDTEIGVATLLVQIKMTGLILVEVYAPSYQLIYLLRSLPDHHLHDFPVAKTVSGDEGVFNVFSEFIGGFGH
ncbi:MAG: hypothetical protein BWY72_02090 [Bacteroidetes bacterium ADurb.Bin416]|nr:MAG: hypothetical protein BWY72_02090 [Bacteroidetes bacterium ADurb.Bin416]